MKRTQIYLPEEMYFKVKTRAKRLRLPMAEVIRTLVIAGLVKENTVSAADDILELTKLKIRGGPKDLSTKFDEYLYGEDQV